MNTNLFHDPEYSPFVNIRVHSWLIKFPVLYDDGIARLYDLDGHPVSVFIDRQGNVRYL